MSAPLIQLREVCLSFGGYDIFQNIDLILNERERSCLVGRNGSGKSTLLKLIAGLMHQGASMSFRRASGG